MDVINPSDAPAMNYATVGGPSAEKLETIMKHLNRTGKIAAISVAAWNPKLDDDGRTRDVCTGLLDALSKN